MEKKIITVAIDDEPLALKVIENYCLEIDHLKLEKTFMNPEEGLRYLNKFPAELLLLDIDMPELNGIDLYRQLKQDVMVIFITSRADYAVEGFNLRAVDYLVKPFTFERFSEAVKRAKEFLSVNLQHPDHDKTKFLYIRADFSLVKIPIADILYVEAYDDYLKIHIRNQKTLVARMTMKGILEKLPNNFIRVHRSFIVPLERIASLKTKSLKVEGREIPVGNSYIEDLNKRFEK
jgi:DNA-binding LytR/AlgR family response regulator